MYIRLTYFKWIILRRWEWKYGRANPLRCPISRSGSMVAWTCNAKINVVIYDVFGDALRKEILRKTRSHFGTFLPAHTDHFQIFGTTN